MVRILKSQEPELNLVARQEQAQGRRGGGGGGRETGRGVAAVEPFALYQFRYSMEGWEMNVGGEVRERARRERQSTRGEKEGRENSARGDGLGL